VEQIIAEAGLPAGSVNAAVVSLRLKGLIKQFPGDMFARR
jgi:predicted Rossmann fold nucleotide-binding protein DprA/Smf involved in DNA uptake